MKLADRTPPSAWKPCETPPHSVLSVRRRTRHAAFGLKSSQQNLANPAAQPADHIYGFTGRETDDESDLNFYRARYYDPAVARFISQDPIGFEAGDANLYRYVGNGPTNGIDPSGLDDARGLAGSVADMRERLDRLNDLVRGLRSHLPKDYHPITKAQILADYRKYSKERTMLFERLQVYERALKLHTEYEDSTVNRETRLSADQFITKYNLHLNSRERSILTQGCMGVTAVSLKEWNPSMNERVFGYGAQLSSILAQEFRDSVHHFARYEDARSYYNELWNDGQTPALYGYCGSALKDTTDASEGQRTNEVHWSAIYQRGHGFDYVILANIDTGFGKRPQWIHSEGARKDVLITPVKSWYDPRHVTWGVMAEPDNIRKDYDLSFHIPATPWERRPPEWRIGDSDD
jgi:RHS repeat-associated protein